MNRFKENSGKDNLVRYKFFKNSDGDIAVKPCSKDANGYYSLIEEENSLGFKQIVFTSGLLIKILLSLLYFHGFQIIQQPTTKVVGLRSGASQSC